MYLKSVKIEGFKSFANKTTFELNKGITAIVGPNGSGKSNIVDAIRWVLGEQSLKSLRGGNIMSDVIFSGSSTTKPMSKASVTLTFDNKDNYLNTDFREVEVKRCIYKSGENEYYLNNTKVRLKDITNLFIDSGAGTDAFNIISQGTVSDIVNSKPESRRVIIESAAGVLKYKMRKEESLRKLDKTKDNLDSINLVIDELSLTRDPLKKDAEVAEKYLELKNNLKNTEVALVTSDITNIHKEYVSLEKEEDALTKKLESMQKITNNEKEEELNLKIYKLDDKISENTKKLLALTEEIAKLDSDKRITIERTKYEYSQDKVQNNLINLKEEELSLIKNIDVTNNEIDTLKENIKEKMALNNESNIELNNLKLRISTYNKDLEDLEKDKQYLENRIDILKSNILNNEKVPQSVRSILNNPRLKGIHNTISSLLTIDRDYEMALEVVLSSSANFIVVDNEASAKSAISYLKDNNLGRATFLPLNIIKSRYMDKETIERLTKINGYVGILSDLVKYDEKYQNIMENQMGNVIVAKDIDTMNLIAKIMNYRFRVISLDGSIIYAGGSISGGTVYKHSNVNLKSDLENYQNKLEENTRKQENIEVELKNLNSDYEILSNKLEEIGKEVTNLTTIKDSKITILDEYEEKLKVVKNDIMGLNNLENNSLDKTLENILNKLNTLNIEKEKLENTINDAKNKKDTLSNDLRELQLKVNNANKEYRDVSNNLNEVKVNMAKYNVKLDNLLLTLNEDYNLTYEYAKDNFSLDMDEDLARKEVHKFKNEIKSLGDVNTGSIEEYKRINERYEFLTKQKNDLEVSMEGLYNIINDMDNIMEDKFKETFTKVASEFSKVFKIMFQGGEGRLELTNPDDYLNTGIEMIITPPGKKINNTQSLSGGEKALTAICLLFAILNVSPVPFIVLDEVEAALDEVNVDLFGEYLNKKKLDSQYILITHKKRMMEYADVLYGITMQNAGISKVVGVKLEGV